MNFKKTILILFVGALTVAGCKKSKLVTPDVVPDPIPTTLSFDQLKYADIVAQDKDGKFSNVDISVTTNAGNVLKPGAILLYKTNLSNYGKLKIVSIDANYLLTLDIQTYNPMGVKFPENKVLTIDASYACNLDNSEKMLASDGNSDFRWFTTNKPSTFFKSNNGAVFYRYSN